ncbi:unnamed protein product [Adineta steineri]|uniref:Uncharacterized protein n=1 Tax=Adineta steineri TaxID=433720 RepID=A0A813WD00_9BILA|nr:unnamed protein product [Adineta steineri]CAF1307829.1 unnamed protein product [Adineta steineri]CAF1308922.1 unnamed protein product [Adineta steineri]
MSCWSRKKVYKPCNDEHRKVVIVGDSDCGKSCLLQAIDGQKWSDPYTRTFVDSYVVEKFINEQKFELTLLDTNGSEEYDRLRPLSYPMTDIFIMCFAIDNPESFKNVSEKWLPECKHFCPLASIVLVGICEITKYAACYTSHKPAIK